MRRPLLSLLAVALALPLPAHAAPKPLADHPACKDHEIFTRMPGFFLPGPGSCEERCPARHSPERLT